MPVLDGDFEAFVTNLGKYNEGMLVGEWVKLPTTEEEMQKVFERIGIGKQDEFGQPYGSWNTAPKSSSIITSGSIRIMFSAPKRLCLDSSLPAAALPAMPRLSKRSEAMPFCASPSARNFSELFFPLSHLRDEFKLLI